MNLRFRRIMRIKIIEEKMRSVSEADKHFIAGLIEGEGCFVVFRNSHKRSSGKGKCYYYSPTFALNNTNFTMIKYLHKILRVGHVRVEPHQKRKCMAKFAIESEVELAAFLNVFIPYLKWKKAEAELLLEWIISRMPKFRRKRGYSKREIEIYHLMRNIKSFSIARDEVVKNREQIRRDLNAF